MPGDPVLAEVPTVHTPTPAIVEQPRGVRERTPERRASETTTLRIEGRSHYVTVSKYPDGRPCEVFIAVGQVGSALRGLYDTIGVLMSHYLQIGGDVRNLAESLRFINFDPAGCVGGDLGIDTATSPIDAIAQLLMQTTDACDE